MERGNPVIAFKLAFLAAVGWSLGCYVFTAIFTVLKNSINKRR